MIFDPATERFFDTALRVVFYLAILGAVVLCGTVIGFLAFLIWVAIS